MIFIEGDANLRPWSPRARKVIIYYSIILKMQYYDYNIIYFIIKLVSYDDKNVHKK